MAHLAEERATELLRQYWDQQLPVNPIHIANKLGIKVYTSDSIGYDGCSGKLVPEGDDSYAILVAPNEYAERKRFTIAHELGHFALSHGPANRERDSIYSRRNYKLEEVHANMFAAELLMPADLVKQGVDLQFTLSELASTFGVSEMAMSIRLKNLNLLSGY